MCLQVKKYDSITDDQKWNVWLVSTLENEHRMNVMISHSLANWWILLISSWLGALLHIWIILSMELNYNYISNWVFKMKAHWVNEYRIHHLQLSGNCYQESRRLLQKSNPNFTLEHHSQVVFGISFHALNFCFSINFTCNHMKKANIHLLQSTGSLTSTRLCMDGGWNSPTPSAVFLGSSRHWLSRVGTVLWCQTGETEGVWANRMSWEIWAEGTSSQCWAPWSEKRLSREQRCSWASSLKTPGLQRVARRAPGWWWEASWPAWLQIAASFCFQPPHYPGSHLYTESWWLTDNKISTICCGPWE